MEFKIENEKLEFTFAKKLDTSAIAEFEKELKDKINEETFPVVFDLSGVEFVSSMFLRVCLSTYKAKGKGNFSIINAAPQIKSVFMIAGFGEMLG